MFNESQQNIARPTNALCILCVVHGLQLLQTLSNSLIVPTPGSRIFSILHSSGFLGRVLARAARFENWVGLSVLSRKLNELLTALLGGLLLLVFSLFGLVCGLWV